MGCMEVIMDKDDKKEYPLWVKLIALAWMAAAYIAFYHNYLFK